MRSFVVSCCRVWLISIEDFLVVAGGRLRFRLDSLLRERPSCRKFFADMSERWGGVWSGERRLPNFKMELSSWV